MTARVRPITVMAATAVVVLVLAGAFAWTRDDDAVVGQPSTLPIVIGARAESARAPVTTTTGGRTYVPGEGLVDPGASLAAWSVSSAEVDPAAVRRLADAFGAVGDLHSIDGGWQIGADGEATVRVASIPGASWTYSPGGPPEVAIVCAAPASDLPLPVPAPDVPTSSGDVGVDGCTSTPAPEGVPTPAEAEDATRDLLRRIGLDVAHTTVTGTSGPWGAQATATPELDGTATRGIDTLVVFGAHAAVTSASGWLGQPTKGDTYPLIGMEAAIGRLNDGRDMLDGLGPMPMGASIGGADDVTTGVSGLYPTTVPVTTIPATDSPTATDGTTTPPTDWGCAVPLTAPAPGAESSSGGGPATTTTVVGNGDGDAGGSGGSGPSCPGTVCPAPPCPSDMACAYACAVPPCDPAACSDPYPGPTVVPESVDPPPAPDDRGVITITSIDLVLAAVPGSDGRLWLVPAYLLTGDDGSKETVLAVDDSFVGSAPPPSEPATDPTALNPTGTAQTAPADTSVPAGPADGACCPPTPQADGSTMRCQIACTPGSPAPAAPPGS